MATLTVTDIAPRIQYTATVGQTVFTIPFKFFADEDVKVYLTPSGSAADDDADLLTVTTDYTLVGAGVESGTREVTLTSGASAGDIVTIRRDVPVKRLTDYSDVGDFLAETVNTDLDKIVMMLQQVEDYVENRCLVLAETAQVSGLSLLIPDPSGKDGDFLRISSDGTSLEWETVDIDAIAAAVTAAETAQTAAETAQTAAETAQTAAETAQTGAETAQTGAETAETGAEVAQAAAEAAAAAAASPAQITTADITPPQDAGYLLSSAEYANKHLKLDLSAWSAARPIVVPSANPYAWLVNNVDGTLDAPLVLDSDAIDHFIYAEKSTSIASEESNGSGLSFSADGTKMYAVGWAGDEVLQYTLSTAWDVSTASYATKALDVSGQDGQPEGMFFKPDGTSLYVVGLVTDAVYQYDLSTAWDISTATYASKSADVSGQEGQPEGVFFKPDGTSLYVVGLVTDAVYQYDLSTAWDVSTASYATKSLDVSGQDTDATSIAINSDGTELLVGGNANNSVYRYSLSTAWDISTATYDSVVARVSTQDLTPDAIFLRPNDATLYVLGSSNDTVFQYARTYSPKISAAAYANKSISVASETVTPRSIVFGDDGTKMYVISNGGSVYQYALSTPWDMSTAAYASKTFSVATQEASPMGVALSADGTTMYVVGGTNDTVYQYTLSTAWDVSTASYATKSFSVATQENNPRVVAFSADGTAMYVAGYTNATVYQYTLSTAWDVSTASYAAKSLDVSGNELWPEDIAFNADGTVLYVVGVYGTDTVYEYLLTTPWEVGSGVYSGESFAVGTQDTGPSGLAFSQDGTKMYVGGYANDAVYQYDTGIVSVDAGKVQTVVADETAIYKAS